MSKVEELHRIFNEKGRKSKELYKELETYVYYLLNKYYREWNSHPEDKEDRLQDAFRKVYHSLSYFDPKKGNMATFLHRAVRNCIQVDQHYSNLDANMRDKSEFDFGSVRDYKYNSEEKNDMLINKAILNNMSLKYSQKFINDFCDKNIASKPVERLIAWRKLNCRN